MTDATQTAPAAAATSAAIPANVIPTNLPHPIISGPPLARGVRYQHHFVIDLISDGQRLWDVASAQGKKVIAEINGEVAAEKNKGVAGATAASAHPAIPAAGSGPAVTGSRVKTTHETPAAQAPSSAASPEDEEEALLKRLEAIHAAKKAKAPASNADETTAATATTAATPAAAADPQATAANTTGAPQTGT